MNCLICKQGNTQLGVATVTLGREQTTLVFKGVPAEICSICGEEYIDDATTSKLLKTAVQAVQAGVQVDVRDYKAA